MDMLHENFLAGVAFLFASTGYASERLYVKVHDDKGIPISNAKVNIDSRQAMSSEKQPSKGKDHDS